MPRSKIKSCSKTITGNERNTDNSKKTENELKEQAVIFCEKMLDSVEARLNKSLENFPPDLSKFKYDKKPHVKIEFEKVSPLKEVRLLCNFFSTQ